MITWLRACGPDLRLCILAFLLVCHPSCKNIRRNEADTTKPTKILRDYFDAKYLLYRLPDDYYKTEKLNQSFTGSNSNFLSDFRPVGHNPSLNLQYTHIYSKQCVYHTSDSVWKYAEVCFPNTCLTKDNAYASVKLSNASAEAKTFYVRLFYQNTTYWYPTDDSINLSQGDYLDNYYGGSQVEVVTIPGHRDSIVKVPYILGLNPKGEFDFDPSKDPARAGNYEFVLVALTDKEDILVREYLDLKKINPFAEIKKDQLQNAGKRYAGLFSYTGPHHFKFVFLDEYFDGTNDLAVDHIYIPKVGKEKRLCDTCTGWYRDVISEDWTSNDFFKGYISKANFIKADYGIKRENTRIDTGGITLSILKSTKGDYKKTWGEFLFGPSFKYGHLTVHAKFAQMMNASGTPNGIIHNLWLYERDPDPVDTTNPYSYIRNWLGQQPYEIDFEIWSAGSDPSTIWDPLVFINYSIVDYMRDARVSVKPGEQKSKGKYTVDRFNGRQLNIEGPQFDRSFFDSFHTYELFWYPDHVKFMVDGQEKALITGDEAKIPDKYMFLWIGSPLYQDGTYYSQTSIPFLANDKKTIIDYIKIE